MTVAPTAVELVAAAKKAAGVTTDDDLARFIERRYGIKVAQSTVSRWKNDASGPGYTATIAMLDLVGWLNTTVDRPVQATSADPLEKLAAGVAALEKTQKELLRLARAQQAGRKSPGQEKPKAKEAGR